MNEEKKEGPLPEMEQENKTSQDARRFSRRGSFFERTRRHFLAGVLFFIPVFVATWAVYWIMGGAETLFGGFVRWLLRINPGDPKANWPIVEVGISVVSFLLACFVLILVGYLSTFFLIRKVILWGEGVVGRLPIIKFLYNTPKEVLQTFALSRKNSFKRVVMVEYPRKGMWCLAFATGEVRRRPDNQELVAIFLPTTPNPTSGFLIYVNVDEVYDTNIPVEQGARMIISGGILSPHEICMQKFSGLINEPALPPLGPLTIEDADPNENPLLPIKPKEEKKELERTAGG